MKFSTPPAQSPGRRRSGTVALTAALGVALTALTAGCASEAEEFAAKPATIERLAAKIDGCKPNAAPGRLKGYRQANCKTPSGSYVLNTFSTDKGQGEWLDYAKLYGGTYLVGPRWIVVGQKQALEKLKERTGGKVHTRNTKTNIDKPYVTETG